MLYKAIRKSSQLLFLCAHVTIGDTIYDNEALVEVASFLINSVTP